MNPLIPIGIAAIVLAGVAIPAEEPSITVTVDDDQLYHIYLDQHRAGPGYLHVKVLYWDGNTGTFRIAASAPFTIPCMELLQVEYHADSGKTYVWDGEVRQ